MYSVNPQIKQTNFQDETLGLTALYAAHEIEATLMLLIKEIQETESPDIEWMGMASLAKRVKQLNSVVISAISETPMSDELHKELVDMVG